MIKLVFEAYRIKLFLFCYFKVKSLDHFLFTHVRGSFTSSGAAADSRWGKLWEHANAITKQILVVKQTFNLFQDQTYSNFPIWVCLY